MIDQMQASPPRKRCTHCWITMPYAVGDAVEVAGRYDEGFPHSWFVGRVTRVHRTVARALADTLVIAYPDFSLPGRNSPEHDEHSSKSLRVRPALPANLVPASISEYQRGDRVDVMDNAIWWQAVVVDRTATEGVHVYLTGSRECMWVTDPARVRPGKVWIAGAWHDRPMPDGLPKYLLQAVQKPPPQQAAPPAPQQQQQAGKGKGKVQQKGKGKAAKPAAAAAREPSHDENEEVLVRRSVRERKSRLTTVDGHSVLRLNMYDLETGERSVFDQELARSKGKKQGSSSSDSELGPAAAWVAVQNPAKRQKPSSAAAAAAAGAAGGSGAGRSRKQQQQEWEGIKQEQGVKEEDGEEASEYEEEEEEEGDESSFSPSKAGRWNAEVLAHNAAVKADARAMAGRRAVFLEQQLQVLRPFITPEVAAAIRSKATAAREAGLPELPPPVETQPDCLEATLREYQLEGLRWMVGMWDQGVNAILADEMGLGKTLQTISLLSYLKFERGVEGPHLIVVPLSVLPSWMGEFAKWSPQMRVVRLHTSDPEERKRLKREVLSQPGSFDVAVTTYDMVKSKDWSQPLSRMLRWRYLVLDEGHKIKCETTQLAHAMRHIQRQQTLLLTGTPLQNNMHELYALLSYLFPDVFTTPQPFDEAFDLRLHKVDAAQLEAAHHMMRPFCLRRLKQEVELGLPPLVETRIHCPLSLMQTFWYRRLLLKDSAVLLQVEKEVEGKVKYDTANQSWKKLQMLIQQLRKCCNHPFLFPGAEPDFDGHTTGESIVTASGKMDVLDRLLRKLKKRGHRVVLFSQFNMQLDILEDYMQMRGYKYSRLDGSTNRVQRMIDIRLFNRPGSEVFMYLLNTRAGGLGVNLQTADTCILYDTDWNPQSDLQAMARVHRIGQKKPVHVYRLCTEGTIEERIQQRAEKKLFLDQMVNRGSVAGVDGLDSLSRQELLSMLRFGCDRIFQSEEGRAPTDAELDAIIDRSGSRAAAAEAKAARKQKGGGNAGSGSSAGAGLGSPLPLVEAKATAASFDAEQKPLSTFILQGKDYGADRTLKSIGAEFWQQQGKGMRERRQRLVQVEGHAVLRENMYDMRQGEPSVFEREAAALKGKAGDPKSKAQVAGKHYDHQDFCQVCWDGGDLVCCDGCPASYHPDCLGLSWEDVEGQTRWVCPQHSCAVCHRKSQAVGGMLFRCEACPHAFCEDHLPQEADVVMECQRFVTLGQRRTATACYVRCGADCGQLADALYALRPQRKSPLKSPLKPPRVAAGVAAAGRPSSKASGGSKGRT